MMRKFLIAVACALLLAGCEQRAPENPNGDVAVQATDASKPQNLDVLTDAAHMLSIRPGTIDRCAFPDGFIETEISWDATSAKTQGVHVFLQNPGEDRKLWSSAGAVGKDRTGRWMKDGSTVILVNASDDAELSRLVIKDVPCG